MWEHPCPCLDLALVSCTVPIAEQGPEAGISSPWVISKQWVIALQCWTSSSCHSHELQLSLSASCQQHWHLPHLQRTGWPFSHLPKISPEIKSVSQNLISLLQNYKQLNQPCWHLQYECWTNSWNCQLLAPCCNNKIIIYPGFFESTFHSRPSSSEAMHKLYIGSASPICDRQPPTGWITELLAASISRTQHIRTWSKQGCYSADPQLLFACFSAHLFRPYTEGKQFVFFFSFNIFYPDQIWPG